MSLNIYFVNESSVLDDNRAWNITWACDHQARFQFGRSGWRSDVRCIYVPKAVVNVKIPTGGSIIHFLDKADQQGALGYHDEDGNEVPFARIFVVTTREAGEDECETASHEALELAVDQHINDSCLDESTGQLWAKEVGDPCQGNGYDVGEPDGHTTGLKVADFTLPNFFDLNTPAGTKTDYRGALTAPFQCGPQGYYSFIDMKNYQGGWQSAWGEKRTSAPVDQDDRLARRVGKA